MSQALNQSVLKGIRILEVLTADDFEAKTLEHIAKAAGIPGTTTWRLLKTLEASGWVVEMPAAQASQSCWQSSHPHLRF